MMAQAYWSISTVAGTGAQGYAGDGGAAQQALLNNPFDLAFDPAGNLCFSDTFNHCIRRIDARSGVAQIGSSSVSARKVEPRRPL